MEVMDSRAQLSTFEEEPLAVFILIVGEPSGGACTLQSFLEQFDNVEVVCVSGREAALKAGQDAAISLAIVDLETLVVEAEAGGSFFEQDGLLEGIPILAVLECLSDEAIAQAYDFGASDCLTVAMNPNILLAKLRVFLRLKESSRRLMIQKAGELEELETRYRYTFHNLAVGISHIGLDGALNEVNRRFCEMLGYTVEELTQKTMADITHADDWTRSQKLFAQLTTEAIGNYSMRVRYCHKGGGVVWSHTQIVLQKNSCGEVQYCISLVQDISREKALADKVQSVRDLYRVVADTAGCGVWEWDHRTQKIFHSSSWKGLLGYNEDEIGDSPDEFISRLHPEDQARVLESMQAHLIHPRRIDMEYRLRGKDGSYRWMRARSDYDLDAEGKLLRTYGGNLDITADKLLQDELRSATIQAEAANEAKSMFLSNMSHELRTPLNPIIGLSEMIVDGDIEAKEVVATSKVIYDAGKQMLELVEEILNFEKIESGRFEPVPVWVDIGATIGETVDLLAPSADRKDLKIQFNNSIDSTLQVEVDPVILRQICFNLIGNAIKFSKKGLVQIRSKLEKSAEGIPYLIVSVADEGIGIAEADYTRVLRSFEQVDNRASRSYGGNGLGLAVVDMQVQAMGGEIVIDSTLGVGSCFTISLPVRVCAGTGSVPDQDKAYSAAVDAEWALGEERVKDESSILLVEDDWANQKLAEALLGRMGIDVVVASSGEEAIKHAKSKSFKLILMDLKMPRMDGFTATRKIREMYPEGCPSKIIACTANANKETEARCREFGMDGFLQKPIDTAAFKDLINHHFGS